MQHWPLHKNYNKAKPDQICIGKYFHAQQNEITNGFSFSTDFPDMLLDPPRKLQGKAQ